MLDFRPHLVFLCCALLSACQLASAGGTPPVTVECSQLLGTQRDLNACAHQDFERASAANLETYQTLMQGMSEPHRRLLQQAQTAWNSVPRNSL